MTASWSRRASTSASTRLPGYDSDAAQVMPHAWKAGAQTVLLRRQLEAMEDGGVVLMSVPANPFRCPPGPYERASLIAHYLKTQKPKSKLIVLDSKDTFSKQKLFMAAWQELYPDHLEWVSLAGGGKTVEVDAGAKTIVTEFGSHKGAVANVIPPQRAGAIAIASGLADRSGWCPIDPVSFEFEARAERSCHRRCGDRGRHAEVGVLRQRAGQALRACRRDDAARRGGAGRRSSSTPATASWRPTTASRSPAFTSPAKGLLADVEGAGGTSPGGASREFRAREAIYADAWFKMITESVYG